MATTQAEFVPGAIATRRNKRCIDLCDLGDQTIMPCSKTNTSPMKQSASNSNPSQSRSHGSVLSSPRNKLMEEKFLSDDLGDQIFGELVTTCLARRVLEQFLSDGIVLVYDEETEICIKRGHEKILLALEAAYDNAVAYRLASSDMAQQNPEVPTKTSTEYRWKWATFPKNFGLIIRGRPIVDFFNSVADRALGIAKKLGHSSLQIRNRFAYPKIKFRDILFGHEPDQQDIRPDFVVLPIEAFTGDQFRDVDQSYINLMTALVVEEDDFMDGLGRLQRHISGIRHTQPWVRYGVGMVVTYNKIGLLREDASGVERVEMLLDQGQGCLDFIRVLLGMVTTERERLGPDPEVDLGEQEVEYDVSYESKRTSEVSSVASADDIPVNVSSSFSEGGRNSSITSNLGNVLRIRADQSASTFRCPATPISSVPDSSIPTLGFKMGCLHIASDEEEGESCERQKTTQDTPTKVRVRAYVPTKVHGRPDTGILFASGSVRGRKTTVYPAVEGEDKMTFTALKPHWQDDARVKEVLEKLQSLTDHHPHSKARRKGDKDDAILGSIRPFVDCDIDRSQVERHALVVTLSELRRPVQYFWSVHDFVRGIKGALIGHEHLCQIGVLHRDISENNIVLPLYPGDEEGTLIDFGMAPYSVPHDGASSSESTHDATVSPSSPLLDDAEPAVTRLYMSINVLEEQPHTHFDDIESFFYVLVLFFISYAGPLPREHLKEAHKSHFTDAIGSEQPPHVRRWSSDFRVWAFGCTSWAQDSKRNIILTGAGNYGLIRRWPVDQRDSIKALLTTCSKMFADGQVSHQQFIGALEQWLKEYADDEAKHCQCPFRKYSRAHSPHC